MEKSPMSVWFEGFNQIKSDMQNVNRSLENMEEHFLGIISLMPGITDVELVKHGEGYLMPKTNEKLMKRTNILVAKGAKKNITKFD